MNNEWYSFSLAFIVVAILFSVGIYMLYSVITGKDIPEAGKKSLSQIKWPYKLRVVAGLGFVIMFGILLFSLIKMLFEY